MSSQKIIKDFIANIIDIYDDDAIIIFINDGNINIDNIIHHHLTKLSVLYQVVFNHLYGTWATKKDFMSFCIDTLNIKKNYNTFNVTIDGNLVNAILAHPPFFIARIGALYKLNTLQDTVNTTVIRLNENSTSFICDIIQQKWKYRYNVMDVERLFVSNILKTFIKYQMNNVLSNKSHCDVWRNVSGFIPEHKELNDKDYEYMNKYEVIQYHLHSDNRFLLQLASAVVIVKENNDFLDNDIYSIIKSIHQHSKKHVMMLSIDNEKIQKVRFSYRIDKDLYFILPKISTKFYLISNDKRLSAKVLCALPSECMLITNIPNELTPEQKSHFGLLLTSCIDKVSPQDSIYHFPSLRLERVSSDSLKLIEEIQQHIWKEYNNIKCPFKSQSSRHCGVLFVNFLSLYLHNNITNIIETLQKYSKDIRDFKGQYVAIVAVDNRCNIMTLLSVIVSLYNVVKNKQTKRFNCIIYTSNCCVDKYKKLTDGLSLTSLISVRVIEDFDDVEMFHMEVYNQVLKNEQFWNTLDCEKCIIVQDDGFLMDGKFINDYLQYDYIGAPWADAKDNEYIKKHINPGLVGNGGFSIRDVEKMKYICRTYKAEKNSLFYHNINEIPEDVYFVKHLVQMKANVAPFDIARKFAIEQVLSVNPVGFHKFWMYNLPIETVKILNSFLE
jgi:Protein of unknown function (DUF5672)